jgi:hypothetical protein
LERRCRNGVENRGYSENLECMPALRACLKTGVWKTNKREVIGLKRK